MAVLRFILTTLSTSWTDVVVFCCCFFSGRRRSGRQHEGDGRPNVGSGHGDAARPQSRFQSRVGGARSRPAPVVAAQRRGRAARNVGPQQNRITFFFLLLFLVRMFHGVGSHRSSGLSRACVCVCVSVLAIANKFRTCCLNSPNVWWLGWNSVPGAGKVFRRRKICVHRVHNFTIAKLTPTSSCFSSARAQFAGF